MSTANSTPLAAGQLRPRRPGDTSQTGALAPVGGWVLGGFSTHPRFLRHFLFHRLERERARARDALRGGRMRSVWRRRWFVFMWLLVTPQNKTTGFRCVVLPHDSSICPALEAEEQILVKTTFHFLPQTFSPRLQANVLIPPKPCLIFILPQRIPSSLSSPEFPSLPTLRPPLTLKPLRSLLCSPPLRSAFERSCFPFS